MKRIFIIFALAICIFHDSSFGDESTHRQAALKMLEAAQTQKMLDQLSIHFETMINQQMSTVDIPAEGKEEFDLIKKDWIG